MHYSWLVDPLDGARSFVRGEPEFTVNIGLIQGGKPLLGVIYLPPQDALYWGKVGQGAYRSIGGGMAEPINVRVPSPEGLVVVRSKSHPSKATAEYLKHCILKENISCSSSSKFCLVAEGGADIYPRFGRTMEWDTPLPGMQFYRRRGAGSKRRKENRSFTVSRDSKIRRLLHVWEVRAFLLTRPQDCLKRKRRIPSVVLMRVAHGLSRICRACSIMDWLMLVASPCTSLRVSRKRPSFCAVEPRSDSDCCVRDSAAIASRPRCSSGVNFHKSSFT